jgi:hypothetical protein
MRTMFIACAGAIIAGAEAGPIEPTYLVPESGHAAIGQEMSLALRPGIDADSPARPWPAAGVPWLFVRTDSTQRNRHGVGPEDPLARSISVRLLHPGVTMVGIEQPVSEKSVAGADLAEFAVDRATIESDPPALDGDIVLRRIESAKALIRVRNRTGASIRGDAATSKSGQRVELRALVDPTAVPIGSDIWVRAYVNGSSVPRARVFATNVDDGRVREALADGAGIASFRLDSPGRWRIEFHRLAPPLPPERQAPPRVRVIAPPTPGADGSDEPGSPRTEPDWVLYSATLTFDAGEGGRP